MRLRYTPNFTAWLEFDGRYLIGEKEAEILEGIQTVGSFMGTAKALGISYAHAWNAIDRVSKILGEPIVEARRGGDSGGGAKLTEAGLSILQGYKNLENQIEEVLSYKIGKFKIKSKLFSHEITVPDLSIIGSHCIGIEILIELLAEESKFRSEFVSIGSSGGLAAVMLGETDIAGVHLLDEVTGEYNVPFLKRYFIDDKAIMVRGYLREQGFLLVKGNPKNIKGFGDLLKKDVKFVNRGLGSGTRSIVDREIRRMAEERGLNSRKVSQRIKGYNVEVNSHTEVAKALIHGKADVGVGIRAAAERFGLDFVPLLEEHFDFVIDRKRLKKPLVNLFIKMLGSDRFKSELERRASGIRMAEETGNIIYEP
ncbi:MAG: LysR family transcriptional regulator [Candidatus Methylarchaceae archaeon HK02M1]|nr:LysR family transcriptional regulator [Candidatus Methylarchaceae archaeon HK02M1]